MFAHPRFSQPGVGHSLAAKLWLVAGLIAASFLPAADAAFQPEAISQLVPCASLEELSDAQLSLADRAKTPYECLAIVYRDALLEIWKHGLSFNFGQLNRSEYNMLYAKYASPWLTPITLTDQLHAPQHNAGNPQSGSATSAIALSASDEENIITAGIVLAVLPRSSRILAVYSMLLQSGMKAQRIRRLPPTPIEVFLWWLPTTPRSLTIGFLIFSQCQSVD
ncbi:unnamed protein product [Prorocentrum cordatum]|uniref:Uncharacterized protein n=1 Tax=Prorocentrum cordatum TaxID=2364126 RepID=A0ABN9YBC0_9DINO|nr:unnamed protein product [Polarella glacialis]